MAWTAKLFGERVIKILQELEFDNFKKLSKNIFKAELKLGKIEVPFIINIHYSRKKAILEDEIKMFFADLNMNKGTVKGIFIGYPEFNKKAREIAEKLDIITLDLYELLNSLSDSSEYRQKIYKEYKNYTKNYIPHQLYDKESHYEFDSLLNYIEHNPSRPVFIEGEIGIGKTTLLKSIFSHLAKKANADAKQRIPFYADLKNFSSYSNLEDFIYQEVFRKNNLKLRSPNSFNILCEEKRLIFLFDNLDKVGASESDEVISLAKQLRVLSDKGVSVIITAPEGYFCVDFKNKLYYTRFLKESFEETNLVLFKIEPFNLSQIKQRISNPKLQRLVSRNEFLKEICKVPIFLDIFSNLDINEDETLEKFSDIYKESIKQWDVEYLTSMGKEMFCEEMARSLFENGAFDIKTDLPAYMENFIENQYKAMPFSLELLKTDIKKAFFIREEKDKNNFNFLHSSFIYFFIAKRLIEEIRKGNYNRIDILSSPLILRFVEDSLGQDKIFNVIIEQYNRERFAREKGEVLFLLYTVGEAMGSLKEIPLNRISTQKIESRNKALVNLQLNDVDFKESDFRNSDFRFAKSSRIDFSSAVLENTNFSFSDFKRSTFNGANMKYLISKQSNFSESTFNKTNLFQGTCAKTDFSKSNFNGTNLHGILAAESLFKKSDFRNCEISNADFHKADFEEASLEDFSCKSVLFSSANFNFAHFKDISFYFSFFSHASFKEAQLFNVKFPVIKLDNCDFEKANLHNVNFDSCDLGGSSFKDASLKEVDFSNADLRDVDFSGAKLCDVTKASLKTAFGVPKNLLSAG